MRKSEIIEYIGKNGGTVTTIEAVQRGISREMLSLITKQGLLVREAQGVYSLPNAAPDELFVLQCRDPRIVFSHETALYLHNMAERTPMANSVTIPSEKRLSPQIKRGCKVYYVKETLFDMGVTEVSSRFENAL